MKFILSFLLLISLHSFGNTLLIRPYGGGSADYVLESTTYSAGIYWPGSSYNPAWYAKTNLSGIDTIIVKDTVWNHLSMFGVNLDSVVILPENDAIITFDWGITLADCRRIFFNGYPGGGRAPARVPTKTESLTARFQIRNTPSIRHAAFEIYGRTQNITLSFCLGERIWYAAQIKTDPQCDVNYNRPSWVIRNIRVLSCRFEDVSQDAIYCFNSSNQLRQDDPVNGRYILCDTLNDGGALDTCQSPNYLPMLGGDCEFAYNVITRCGRQAFVLGGHWYGTTRVHDNYVSHTGFEIRQDQGEFFGIGGASRNVQVYNNVCKYSFLYAVADFGNTTNYIHDNVFDSVGFLRQDSAIVVGNDQNYFLRPNNDLDSLVIARTDLSHIGGIVKNNSGGGVFSISSTTKVYYPTTETKTTQIYNNRFGVNSRTDGVKIGFESYGPPENWTTNSVVCNNTLLDGSTAATLSRFTYLGNPWPAYTTLGCFGVRSTIPKKRGVRNILIAH